MKRYVDELLLLYADLLTDARYAYPALAREFERDLARITQLSKSRGLPFFMVDLPSQGKHLLRCLAAGQYEPSALPASRSVGGGVKIPKLFRGLYLLIFESNGLLKESVDFCALQILRTLLVCAKKAEVECSQEAEDREVHNFLLVDSSIPPLDPSWIEWDDGQFAEAHRGFNHSTEVIQRAESAFGKGRGRKLLSLLDSVSARIALTLGAYNPSEWEFSHGPGAVSNLPKINGIRSRDKFLFTSWSPRLERVFPFADSAFYGWESWARSIVPPRDGDENLSPSELQSLPRREIADYDEAFDREPRSSLTAVLKTLKAPRLIATEPLEHMWCQQNIKHYMYRRSEATWLRNFVSFNSQERNQRLAAVGSQDGSLATIDLSAASDRVSCPVVGNLFRANLSLVRALAATRTRFCILPNDVEIVLRKYSTMGNATTFPVETFVFLAVALACLAEELGSIDGAISSEGKVSVFGDDIVVPTSIAGSVTSLLEVLYFKVNADKTFLSGFFRESCGVEAFRGIDVTPAYWSGPCDESQPESIMATVEVSNNFYKKFLITAAAGIERRCPRKFKIPRVVLGASTVGFQCFCRPPLPPKERWNSGLQRREYLVPCFYSRSTVKPRSNDASLLQYFTEHPNPWVHWKSGVRSRPKLSIELRWVPVTQLSQAENSL